MTDEQKTAKPMNIKEAIAIQQKNISVLVQITDALLKLRNQDQNTMNTLIKVIVQFKNELDAIKSVVFINEPEPTEEPKESGESKSENGGEPNGVRTDGAPAEPPEKPKEETVVEPIPNAEEPKTEEPKEEPKTESAKYPPE